MKRRTSPPPRHRPREGVHPPLRVSVVKYLNTAPLVWGLERRQAQARYRLSYTVPSGCADDLRAGRADIGIIPAIEYQRIAGLKVIPHVSIASQRRVESVLLVSRGPARRAKRVALDTSSRTSVALTKILFARAWKREPDYVEAEPNLSAMLKEADAALLIGDPALQLTLHASAGGEAGLLPKGENWHIYDLAEEWWRLTNLPFVFAVWAVRPEKVGSPGRQRALVHDFLTSRDEGLDHLEEIARSAARALELPGGQLERYLRHSIDFRLDAPHMAGLESFYRYARDQGVIEQLRPVEFL